MAVGEPWELLRLFVSPIRDVIMVYERCDNPTVSQSVVLTPARLTQY